MTRDEWMVLPDGARLHKSLDGRQYAASSDGAAVITWTPYSENTGRIELPLAEFEALLFGPAEGNEYTRAAEAWAEASITAQRLWDGVMDGTIADAAAAGEADARVGACRDAFLRLYRERHDAQR